MKPHPNPLSFDNQRGEVSLTALLIALGLSVSLLAIIGVAANQSLRFANKMLATREVEGIRNLIRMRIDCDEMRKNAPSSCASTRTPVDLFGSSSQKINTQYDGYKVRAFCVPASRQIDIEIQEPAKDPAWSPLFRTVDFRC